jgi:hypothetical protein
MTRSIVAAPIGIEFADENIGRSNGDILVNSVFKTLGDRRLPLAIGAIASSASSTRHGQFVGGCVRHFTDASSAKISIVNI